MTDPFKIDGPTCYSFSMGRSSGYGLRRVLDANPPEVLREYLRVLTCNTGREELASLAFGDRVDREWLRPLGLSLTWLEYRLGGAFAVLPFSDLSTKGEPFEAVIAQRGGVLPNPRSRYCSSEMKTRTMHRYLRSIGWTEWETMIGVRADEQRRVAKFRFNPHPETKAEYVRIPLADAFVTAQQVGDFWKAQPFDLELPNNNGKTMHGNCDLCYLKPAHQVFSLIAEKPERAILVGHSGGVLPSHWRRAVLPQRPSQLCGDGEVRGRAARHVRPQRRSHFVLLWRLKDGRTKQHSPRRSHRAEPNL